MIWLKRLFEIINGKQKISPINQNITIIRRQQARIWK